MGGGILFLSSGLSLSPKSSYSEPLFGFWKKKKAQQSMGLEVDNEYGDKVLGIENSTKGPKNKIASPKKAADLTTKILLWVSTLMAASVNGMYGYMLYKGAERENTMVVQGQNVLPTVEDESPWPENTKVYASVLQNYPARMNKELGGIYTSQLFDNLAKPNVRSLEEAHKPLEQGLKDRHWFGRWMFNRQQVPVASVNNVKGFHKDENRTRYVVMIKGEGSESQNPMFEMDLVKVKEVLQEQYNIPDDHFIQLIEPTPKQVETVCQALSNLSDPTAEVLFYVTSHGLSLPEKGSSFNDLDKEGLYEGMIDGMGPEGIFFEFQMKRLFNKYLKGYSSVNLIVDACFSGAWVAQNSLEPDTTVNPSLHSLAQSPFQRPKLVREKIA